MSNDKIKTYHRVSSKTHRTDFDPLAFFKMLCHLGDAAAKMLSWVQYKIISFLAF